MVKISVRLQKALSNAGFGSRRGLEELIKAGEVQVNGSIAKLGSIISADDSIRLFGKLIENPLLQKLKLQILIYHKPVGEICSRADPKNRKSVFESLPPISPGRWVQVGRLDYNTSGLLLFTNNGELANNLMHPKNAIEREYAVLVGGYVTESAINQMLAGVLLDDGVAKFTKLKFIGRKDGNSWYNVTLKEGRKHEVRRLWQSQGLKVCQLIRIRYGSIFLPGNLRQGQYKLLSASEVGSFLATLKVKHEF